MNLIITRCVSQVNILSTVVEWDIHNHFNAKLNNLNCHPLEIVSRCREPQVQMGENHSHLFHLRANIFKS